jgi:hypothetical protein
MRKEWLNKGGPKSLKKRNIFLLLPLKKTSQGHKFETLSQKYTKQKGWGRGSGGRAPA